MGIGQRAQMNPDGPPGQQTGSTRREISSIGCFSLKKGRMIYVDPRNQKAAMGFPAAGAFSASLRFVGVL
jgi:hypothetical protein